MELNTETLPRVMIDQRARTILKVATELVGQQEAFIFHDVRQLRSFTLSVVTDNVSVHESTVSRDSNNKYIGTPHGTYEIKFSFMPAKRCVTGSVN